MRKKITCFILILSVLITLYPPDMAYAAPSSELNIYAMYLDSNEKGESVLLESKGHYLLIDLGCSSSVPSIIQQLRALGVAHIDLMFSHLHKDHIGASTGSYLSGLYQLSNAGITIDTMYLPNPNLSPSSINNPTRYLTLQSFMSSSSQGRIVYLNVGDHVLLGDTDGEVIGPVNTAQISPQKYTAPQYNESYIYTHYENNCSLAVMFTCGNTRYFTAGDCYEDEAAALVEAYGKDLRCDIMKLCHHGIGSNSKALMKYTQPMYSFACNSGTTLNSSASGRWTTYSATERAKQYGMVYLIGNEKKTIIYRIADDSITLYQGSVISKENKMTGWQYLYGADGVNRTHEMYYLDSDCTPLSGTQQIGSHYYYFTKGGQMDYGDFDLYGSYLGWKSYDNGRRYYKLSSDKKYAYMSTGFSKIEDGRYYFNSNGYCLVNTTVDDTELCKISSDYYLVDDDGAFVCDSWEDLYDEGMRYFDSSGKMLKNGIKTIDGEKYYFDKDGIMQTHKIIKVGKHSYYFGKSGRMAYNKKFTYKGKTYTSNKNGVLTLKKPAKKK